MAEALPARLVAVRSANGELLVRRFHGGCAAGINVRWTPGALLVGHLVVATAFIPINARGEGGARRVRARTPQTAHAVSRRDSSNTRLHTCAHLRSRRSLR